MEFRILNMEKIREYKGIIILILVVLAGAFYWYEWRPSQIRKGCADWAVVQINRNNSGRGYTPVEERADMNHKDFNNYYSRCSKEKGL